MNNISFKEIFRKSISIITSNKKYLVKVYLAFGLGLLPSILLIAIFAFVLFLGSQRIIAMNIFWPLMILVYVIVIAFVFYVWSLSIGLLRIYLSLVDGEKLPVSSLFHNFKLLRRYFVGNFMATLIIIGGLILFIIPGIYFSFRLLFVQYMSVDPKVNIPASKLWRYSWDLTKGRIVKIILFVVSTFIISLSSSFVSRIPFDIIQSLFLEVLTPEARSIMFMISIAINFVVSAIISLFIVIATITFYRRLQNSAPPISSPQNLQSSENTIPSNQ